jgi:hypothetical protein
MATDDPTLPANGPRVLDNVEILYVNLSPTGFASTVVRDRDTGETLEIPGGYVRRVDRGVTYRPATMARECSRSPERKPMPTHIVTTTVGISGGHDPMFTVDGTVLVEGLVGQITADLDPTTQNFVEVATGAGDGWWGGVDVTGAIVGQMLGIKAGADGRGFTVGPIGPRVWSSDGPRATVSLFSNAAEVGQILWTLWYTPLTNGAKVTPAA